MSVRAYKIEKIKEKPTFNLWHDELLMKMLDKLGKLDTLDEDQCGIIEITEQDIKDMEKFLEDKEFTKLYEEKEIERTKEILNEIKKELDPKFKYATYYCY